MHPTTRVVLLGRQFALTHHFGIYYHPLDAILARVTGPKYPIAGTMPASF